MKRVALLTTVAWLAATSLAAAQSYQGGVRGIITDSGGVVPGVALTLTNEQTNVSRSTVSNERGEYVFPAVEPATYRLTATLPGYKTSERPGLLVATQSFIVVDVR